MIDLENKPSPYWFDLTNNYLEVYPPETNNVVSSTSG